MQRFAEGWGSHQDFCKHCQHSSLPGPWRINQESSKVNGQATRVQLPSMIDYYRFEYGPQPCI